ncbi:MAG: DUF2537 domain-containing protein [Thermocrispum sp.]
MQLRIRGERAVLTDGGPAVDREPETLPLGPDLTAALHEWARVASAIRAAAEGDSSAIAEPGEDTVGVVSRRGHQLAGRVATELHRPVQYVDPVTDVATVVVPNPAMPPPGGPRHASPSGSGFFRRTPGEPAPWGPGLTVSVIIGAVVLIGMLALTSTLAEATAGWLAFAAAVVVSGGMAPSLWLGRRVPILRWMCFGAAGGLAASWIGVLFVLF